jgi:hypothetical protein
MGAQLEADWSEYPNAPQMADCGDRQPLTSINPSYENHF